MLLDEMKFLVPNYSCLQNPWLRGYRPQISVLSVLWSQLNFLNPPPPPEKNSWVRHWFGRSQELPKTILELHFENWPHVTGKYFVRCVYQRYVHCRMLAFCTSFVEIQVTCIGRRRGHQVLSLSVASTSLDTVSNLPCVSNWKQSWQECS